MHAPAARPEPPAAGAPTRDPEGWRLGTVVGVPLYLARSWVVIAVVVTLLFAPVVARTAPGLGGAGSVVVVARCASLGAHPADGITTPEEVRVRNTAHRY